MAKQKNTPTTSNQIEPKSCFWDSNEDSKSKPHKLPLQTPNYERFWWFICACWPPPLRWPHEASTAVHETADHCSCPKQGPNLDTVMIHDNLKKQTSKTFLKCSFHAVRLHACVRQLDSLEVALVIVSWWEPNCGGASKTSSAKSWPKEITHFSDLAERNHSLFLFPTAYHNLPEHLWQVYEEGVFRHMTSGKSSKSSFGHRVHQLRSWQLCPVQAKALVTNRVGYLSDWNKNKKL